jgi:ubiquinone/menaquinone biosynthesis C-methylase UbiE
MKRYDPADEMLAGYTQSDGTVEFYTRVNALLQPSFRVLNLGAGRGAWHSNERSNYKRSLRRIQGKVAEYIAADVDEAVLQNPMTDRNVLMKGGEIPLADEYVDLIICDFVLEHVLDVATFKKEVQRVLKSGGFFCARTPHRMNYVSLFARLVKNTHHSRWLRQVQPGRKAEDIFPTAYRCNTISEVSRVFIGWQNFSYVYTAEPRYYFGRKIIFQAMSLLHRIAPASLTGCLFIFLIKQ